jgi:hypothetical protein
MLSNILATLKEIQQSPTGLANPALENEYIGVAAVEFPNSIEPYENLTETNFLYEVLERSILSSNYTKLFRPSSSSDEIYDLLGDFEYHNISEAVKKSTSLTIKLKNFAFTYPTFLSELRQQSVSGE